MWMVFKEMLDIIEDGSSFDCILVRGGMLISNSYVMATEIVIEHMGMDFFVRCF